MTIGSRQNNDGNRPISIILGQLDKQRSKQFCSTEKVFIGGNSTTPIIEKFRWKAQRNQLKTIGSGTALKGLKNIFCENSEKLSFFFGGIQWHQNGQNLTQFYEIPWQAIKFIKHEDMPYFFIKFENGTASDKDLIFYDSKDENWRVIKDRVFNTVFRIK